MKQKKGRVGVLRVRIWSYDMKITATVREGRSISPFLANSDWGSAGFHKDLYTVNLDNSDIPIWEEANGNYVRFKINSEGKAELYYNPKKRL